MAREEWVPITTFTIVLLVHLATRLIACLLRKGKVQPVEHQLASEIKDLLRQASSLSTPSTFAKAAKLRRTAAAKERELVQLRQKLAKEQCWSNSLHQIFPTALKAIAYLSLGCWFWGCTISTIPSQNIQPFDKALSWITKNHQGQKFAMIGILPWLVLCTRVSVFLSHKAIPG